MRTRKSRVAVPRPSDVTSRVSSGGEDTRHVGTSWDNGRMGETASVARVHVIEGRPWKDAIISVLESRSPYLPWHTAGGIEPGHAVIGVLDTDPQSVIAGVGIVGPDGRIDRALAGIDPFYLNGLLELGTLQMLTDFVVHPTAGPVYHYRSPDDIVAVIGAYTPADSDALFGHTTLAAGRVLLESAGTCTGCGFPIDLTRPDARDRVHIHTADPPTPHHLGDLKLVPPHRDGDDQVDGYGPGLIRIGPRKRRRRWFPPDWPATLCGSCRDRMRRGRFSNFLDYRFSLHPRCPSCSAQRSMSTAYGFSNGSRQEPWVTEMGCCVQPWRWVCGECGHEW